MTKNDFVLSRISCGQTLSIACKAEGVSVGEFFLTMGIDRDLGRAYRAAKALWADVEKHRVKGS